MAKTYKLIRIYRVPAENKAQAWKRFADAEAHGDLKKLMFVEFVTEDKPKGWFANLKAQVLG